MHVAVVRQNRALWLPSGLERSAIVGRDAEHEEARRAIIATNRCECSFAHSLGKLVARSSRESWRRDDRSDPR
jgi:hypothetical protein